ncbi:MAG: hypothetical protein WAK35_15290 [Xanthobacteraceae bacterium]
MLIKWGIARSIAAESSGISLGIPAIAIDDAMVSIRLIFSR